MTTEMGCCTERGAVQLAAQVGTSRTSRTSGTSGPIGTSGTIGLLQALNRNLLNQLASIGARVCGGPACII